MTKTWKDQNTPALAIVARGDQIKSIDPNTFKVKSQSNPEVVYRVEREGDKLKCTCNHYQQTQLCIHAIAVKFKEDLKQSAINIVHCNPTCEHCNSDNVVKNGKRHNKSGTINRYLCKDCGHRFTDNQGFQKKRADPEKIALALDLFYRGLSVRKVAEHFQQVYNLDVSHMTVYRWIEHYSRMASEWMDKQNPQTGEKWHIDETILKVDGKARYLWNVLDHDSRFLLATHVSANRSLKNTRTPIKKAKKATDIRPKEVLTDGMMAYPKAVTRELGKQGGKGSNGYWTPHKRVPSIRAKESNNLVERLHSTEKERTKVMRGFDRDIGCANIMEGFRVHYNLVKKHQTLNATPGEIVGLPKIDGFKWYELLKKATA